jgi:hypothetical protein
VGPDLCSYNFHQWPPLIKSLEPCTRGQSKCLDYTLKGELNHTKLSLRLKNCMPLVINQMSRGVFASTVTIHSVRSSERSNVSKVTGSFKNDVAVTRLETYQNRSAVHTMCVQQDLGVVVVSLFQWAALWASSCKVATSYD